MIIVGLDISLNATGVARCFFPRNQGQCADSFGTICPSKDLRGMERLAWVGSQIVNNCEDATLIVIEDLSFGSRDQFALERAGLAYIVRMHLWKSSLPYLLVAPRRLKKFATGSGSAKKEMVVREVFRRWQAEVEDDNQADAVALLALGCCVLDLWRCDTEAQRAVVQAVKQQESKLLEEIVRT